MVIDGQNYNQKMHENGDSSREDGEIK